MINPNIFQKPHYGIADDVIAKMEELIKAHARELKRRGCTGQECALNASKVLKYVFIGEYAFRVNELCNDEPEPFNEQLFDLAKEQAGDMYDDYVAVRIYGIALKAVGCEPLSD